MSTKIDEWGNSLAVRIPRPLLASAKFKKGTAVTLRAVDQGILIARFEPQRPVSRKRKYKLSDLLSRCKGPNPYKFISGGPPVGKEAF